MTAKIIIILFLGEHGYDGLCGEDCGCGIDDLAPCDMPMDCEPAYKHVCNEKKPEDCKMREDCYGECYKLTR